MGKNIRGRRGILDRPFHEAFSSFVHSNPEFSFKQVCGLVMVPTPTMYAYLQGTRSLPLEVVVDYCRICEDLRPLIHLAGMFGGNFVGGGSATVEPDADAASGARRYAEYMREAAASLDQVARALGDGAVSRAELTACENELERVSVAKNNLMACLRGLAKKRIAGGLRASGEF